MNQNQFLVCISSSRTSEQLIEKAALMTQTFGASLTCLYIESSRMLMDEMSYRQLKMNISLAKHYGAKIEIISGDDIPYLISDYSRTNQINKIFIGENVGKFHLFRSNGIVPKLMELIPDIDVYVIPNVEDHLVHEISKSVDRFGKFNLRDFLWSFVILALSSLIGLFFFHLGFTESNIIVVYILGVVVISVVTNSRMYSLVSSVVSVLIFNYFFTIPRFSLQAYDSGYPVTFFIMFLSAFIISSLAVQLKEYAKESSKTAFYMKKLLELNQRLQKVETEQEILDVCVGQLVRLLDRNVVVYLNEDGHLGKPQCCLNREADHDFKDISIKEEEIAQWVLENNHQAGFGTRRYSHAKALYLAIRVNTNVYGVVGIDMQDQPLRAFENDLALSIIGDFALALENLITRKKKEKTEILAKNEQLRANLLRSISHDLRTPLTSISGNANSLMINGHLLEDDVKTEMYSDIYEDSLWLINLVENLLSVTRLEGETIRLNLSVQLVEEVITEAIERVSKHNAHHPIILQKSENIVLAMMDVRLIVQVLINLIDNAIKYTPENSKIEISYYQQEKEIYVVIADHGKGIPDIQKEKVFEMFYTENQKIIDSRRSMGLGLFLCKSVVNAHGGKIWVEDNHPEGSKFIFTLPVKEVSLNE